MARWKWAGVPCGLCGHSEKKHCTIQRVGVVIERLWHDCRQKGCQCPGYSTVKVRRPA